MKKKLIPTTIASALLAIAVSGTAAAAKANSGYHGKAPSPASRTSPSSPRPDAVINVKRLIGQPVTNRHDRAIGRLKTLIVNRSSGSVRYGVVGRNGSYYKVPWSLIRETGNGHVKVDIDGSHLKAHFSAFEPVSVPSKSDHSNGARHHPFLFQRIPFFNDDHG